MVLIIGGTVLLIGIVMIVTPGPAFIVIPAGLAVLAIEFEWARRLLKKARRMFAEQIQKSGKAPEWLRHMGREADRSKQRPPEEERRC